MDLLELKRQFEFNQILLKALKKDQVDEWYIWAIKKQMRESDNEYRKALKQQKN